jgi:hypothetical protein
VVGHQDHGGVLQVPALLAPTHEVLYEVVGDLDSLHVLRVVGASDVAVLVHRQELEYQQLGVVLLQLPAGRGDQVLVDLVVVRDAGYARHVVTESVDEVRYPHQPPAFSRPPQHLEDALDLQTQLQH